MQLHSENIKLAYDTLFNVESLEKTFKEQYGDKWREELDKSLGENMKPLDEIERYIFRVMMYKFLEETGRTIAFQNKIKQTTDGMPKDVQKILLDTLGLNDDGE